MLGFACYQYTTNIALKCIWTIAAEQFRIIRTWVRNKAYCLKLIEKRESGLGCNIALKCITITAEQFRIIRTWVRNKTYRKKGVRSAPLRRLFHSFCKIFCKQWKAIIMELLRLAATVCSFTYENIPRAKVCRFLTRSNVKEKD